MNTASTPCAASHETTLVAMNSLPLSERIAADNKSPNDRVISSIGLDLLCEGVLERLT